MKTVYVKYFMKSVSVWYLQRSWWVSEIEQVAQRTSGISDTLSMLYHVNYMHTELDTRNKLIKDLLNVLCVNI